MSDYLFMLESHLTPGQHKVVAAVDELSREADLPVFVTGGAMRDMLGGQPIRELEFTVQGSALPLAKRIAKKHGARVLSTNNARKAAVLLFPSRVTARLEMAHAEHYPKPGGKPRIEEATIHEDLMRRDFTVNSIALSLHPASRGLLLDPANGLADLEHRELRANNHYAFYDAPVRMLRLIRYRIRLGFGVEPRTEQQYENARLAEMEEMIVPEELAEELRAIAAEPSAGEIVATLVHERLMRLFSPTLGGRKIDQASLSRLDKARHMIPFGINILSDDLGLFLAVLTQKFSPAEKRELAKQLGLGTGAVSSWSKLVSESRKAARVAQSRKLHQPSQVYQAFEEVPCERLLYLYVDSNERIVRDRIRNYLQKYLFVAQSITDGEVAGEGFQPGTSAFNNAKAEMIAAKLDGRKWRRPKSMKVPEAAGSESAASGRKTTKKRATEKKTAKKAAAGKRAAAKKPPAKKTAAKKPVAKKPAVKKTVPAKEAAAKKSAARKKTAGKKARKARA